MSDAPVTFIKKSKKSRPTNARQRPAEEEATEAAAAAATASSSKASGEAQDTPLESSVKRPSKRKGFGALGAQSAGYKSKRSKFDGGSSSDSEAEDESELGIAAKAKSDFRVNFSTSKAATGQSEEVREGDDAARITDLLDNKNESSSNNNNNNNDGLYKGAKNYQSQLPMGSAKYGATAGPSNVRGITITDYQPDVCKDYKETGFCGFGDTCKFLHDRGDYLQGWQMDNMFLSQRPEVAAPEASEEEEELPFACLICRKPFVDPVVTRCGHYFCSSCAIRRFAKTPKCYACGLPTNGLFNKADKILDKKRKAQDARMEARQREMGDFNEDGQDDGVQLEGVEDQGEVPEEVQPLDMGRVTGGQEDSGSEREFYESE